MIVLIVVLAILLLILLIPFGVQASYIDAQLRLSARVAVLRLTLYPPKKASKPKAEKDQKQKKPKKPKKEKPPRPKPSMEELLDLARIGLHAVGRLRRRITINRLMLHVLAASEDPYNTAMYYGGASTALSLLIPQLEAAFNIKEQDIATSFSFEETKAKIDAELILTIDLARIIGIAFMAGIEFLKYRRQRRKAAKLALQAKERTDENGTDEKAQPND